MNKKIKIVLAIFSALIIVAICGAYWNKSKIVAVPEENKENATSINTPAASANEIINNKESVIFPTKGEDKEYVLGEKYPRFSIQADNIENDAGKFAGRFSWGSGTPNLYVTSVTKKNVSAPVDCEYACTDTIVLQLSYYLLIGNDIQKIFTEEVNASHIKAITYTPFTRDWGSNMDKFTLSFLQSINEGYCCDGAGNIRNRIFEVDFSKNKTTVRIITDF